MGVPTDYAAGTLRLSVGRHTTAAEVDRALRLIVAAARDPAFEPCWRKRVAGALGGGPVPHALLGLGPAGATTGSNHQH